ncbi:MAG: MBL fold metallo-hydrolase [Verrucomicrobiota bacterium]|nr:MBL fold metallo-hydrolase [Verrucomicrobiota bacterium]
MYKFDLTKRKNESINIDALIEQPVCLFSNNNHEIYWLGIVQNTAFRCNTYLLVDNDEAIIIDPGAIDTFSFIKKRVSEIISLDKLIAITLSHQDPDVAGSMSKWIELNPSIKVISTSRANVLLKFYDSGEYDFIDASEISEFRFSSGNKINFVQSPFMHFPGAFTIYDTLSRYLFSGDVWAAIDINWTLIVDDFDAHTMVLDLFHTDYIASNIAAKGFLQNLGNLTINAILPQHGSIISKYDVAAAKDYLNNLSCGLDLIYPDIV